MNDSPRPALAPVSQRVLVELPLDDAFALFTRELRLWWPFHGHSCGEEDAVDVEFEERVGGAVTELGRSGARHVWGTLTLWQPPTAFGMTWHPGLPAEQATQLRVEFSAVPGGTQVSVWHAGWEARGQQAEQVRGGYEAGWGLVLARYAARAEGEERA